MDETEKKQFLIKKMLEAKKIEIENNRQNVLYKIKSLFSKPEKPAKERITALKKSLEKKDAEELEYMILQKEGSLLLLEKRVGNLEEKNKLKELIKELNEIKKGKGKREKIAIEVGFEKKEIKELKAELEKFKEKVKPLKEKIKKGIETEKPLVKRKREKRAKRKKPLKKKKSLQKEIKKPAGKRKKAIEKGKKEKIKFISPEEELKQKREEEVTSKRKKALDKFHQEFTSGDHTYVGIKGGAQIIAGKQRSRTAGKRVLQGKTDEQFDFDIQKVKEKIKNLKSAFFHRQISEEDYKKKMFDYQEELNSLEMEKQRPKNYVEQAAETIKERKKRKNKPFVFDSGLKTLQQESIRFATQHTPKSRQKVQNALKEFSQEFSSEPYFGKEGVNKPETSGQPVQPKRIIKTTGIIKRIAPQTSETKIKQMEGKLVELMQKKNIGETEIRKEMEFVSEKELMKKFDLILSSIEQKYGKEMPLKIDEEKDSGLLKEEEYVTTEKTMGRKEGKMKDIEEKRIVTDFDRLLGLVKEKGKINEKTAVKLLNLSPDRVKECYTVLEKNDLIRLDFPVFGGAQIISKEYVEPKKEKKEKKKKGEK